MSCESKGRLSGTSVAFQHLLDKPAAWRGHLQLSTRTVPHWTTWADTAANEGQLTVNERGPFNTLFAGLCMDVISQPRSANRSNSLACCVYQTAMQLAQSKLLADVESKYLHA